MPEAIDVDGDDADGEDERAKLKMEGVSSDELTNKNRIHHSAAYDVILFVKEIVCEYPNLTESILLKLVESFNEIRSEQVYRVALWILGEYCQSAEEVVSI